MPLETDFGIERPALIRRDTGQPAEVPQVSPCQYRFGVLLDNGQSFVISFWQLPELLGMPPVLARNPKSRVLVEKTLEVDFFRSALQKVEARRRPSSESGEKASTLKSGK